MSAPTIEEQIEAVKREAFHNEKAARKYEQEKKSLWKDMQGIHLERADALDAAAETLKRMQCALQKIANVQWPEQPHMEDTTDFEATREFAEDLWTLLDEAQEAAKSALPAIPTQDAET